ncbi:MULTISPECIES: 1-aminocyclopropane-1-carboxylate deaminase [unclassified Lebetimonas]|uniref:1-aminocyclopropane-1-carboxylate deaminase n=1 Tax=unclassified Lebetimonas TaxID=2648158 RepID=UPI000466AEA2|nr:MULTISPECIES: 1-aminocyclopropane-1-carboxylate deaminase [unclassified Lebetimonas]
MQNSPITPFEFRGKFFHIKRDDLLRPFEGNKARKFYYFYKNEFPEIKRVISFGSNQSNAFASLSRLCKIKGWEFIYFTNHIPAYLKQNPEGNYLESLKNDAKIIEINLRGDALREYVLNLKDKNTLIIEEGGRIRESEEGIKILADEINEYAKKNNLKVFLPSGTGTTAYFLAKHLDVEVLTLPCVGDEKYLKKQFCMLGGGKIPTILSPRKKYHFGKLYKNLFEIWNELKNAGIEFDLLYDPIGWESVEYYNLNNILYIHQGGLKGNISMLSRYKRKYKI